MSLSEYKERLKRCFGVRFFEFRDLGDGNFYLFLSDSEFTNLDWNNIVQIGFAYHVGIVSIGLFGYWDKCLLRVHLRAY